MIHAGSFYFFGGSFYCSRHCKTIATFTNREDSRNVFMPTYILIKMLRYIIIVITRKFVERLNTRDSHGSRDEN